MKRNNNRFLSLFSLTVTVSVFNRVLRGINLQFRPVLERISKFRHIHNTVSDKILVISISRHDTNVSDLILVEERGTLRHKFT